MIRLKDIAERANVSTATVSYVLNNTGNVSDKTREKVYQVLKEMNYKPNEIARSLKIKKTSTIGVIVEDITTFYVPEIIDGINKYAEKLGFSILLVNLRIYKKLGLKLDNIEKYKDLIVSATNELLSKQVDGIIYIGVHTRDVTGLIPEINKPIIYTYCYTSSNQDSVNYDDENAAFEATKYLIHKGHSKIAIISGPVDSVPAHRRLIGYHRALMDHQISFNPAYIKTGDWEYQSGYEMAKELLKNHDPPSAIFAMSDVMAGGVLDACRELEIKVPDDLSLIGFDGQECSWYFTPKLTTMKLPLGQMGELSIKKMVERIKQLKNNENHSEKTQLLCELIERESVSCPHQ
ncbi:LacI family DNA-binding transcriptional regulator [Mesobacillus foraminis]|uniref:LacI family transcriptional regulator n=1 Tax=Mesobacillus foraminis TaxID=279826 RepID=A0A4R2B4J0_9BACI|nr:LacI family DNA-binding transcriptional regulator [Mesobacillus foraminis]TCN21163.1 LacI family transcriptional regulator [Mesobacillus foraminis]